VLANGGDRRVPEIVVPLLKTRRERVEEGKLYAYENLLSDALAHYVQRDAKANVMECSCEDKVKAVVNRGMKKGCGLCGEANTTGADRMSRESDYLLTCN
jgi:hypothetical protein